jgi:hypothetical protein
MPTSGPSGRSRKLRKPASPRLASAPLERSDPVEQPGQAPLRLTDPGLGTPSRLLGALADPLLTSGRGLGGGDPRFRLAGGSGEVAAGRLLGGVNERAQALSEVAKRVEMVIHAAEQAADAIRATPIGRPRSCSPRHAGGPTSSPPSDWS